MKLGDLNAQKAKLSVKKFFGEGVQKPFSSLVNHLIVHPHSSSSPYLYAKPRHWEADELVQQCEHCGSPFSLFVRRHHCRNCGGIFCAECTAERIKVVGYDHEERVCGPCYDHVRADIIFCNSLPGPDDDLLIGRIKEGRAKEGEIISRIYDGVPDSLRADLWAALCNIKKAKSTSLIPYSSLVTPNPQHTEKIHLDVMRTFPDNPVIQSAQGQSALTNLLHALMALYPSLGYAQHSAYVAGMVLIVMGWEREEDAFWILAQLFDKTKGPLAPGRVDAAVDYVRSALEGTHPDLASHLVGHRITLDVFVHRWFSTIFSYDLPLPFGLVVWDLLLACGHLFSPALALALLDQAREDLVQLDANGIVKFFNHLPPSLFDEDHTLLDDAFSHWCHIKRRLTKEKNEP